MELILKHFPHLSADQIRKFEALDSLYKNWNLKINVISRKNIDELYLKHVLHSLSIAKVIAFKDNTKILDVGTGGGFPGIPLAILFPNCKFYLVDSTNKKLRVINAICDAIDIKNVKTTHSRVESLNGTYEFVLSRAVASMPTFVSWVKDKISKTHNNCLKNGILYLKGGDLTEELKVFKNSKQYPLSAYFKNSFFDTKKLVYLPFE